MSTVPSPDAKAVVRAFEGLTTQVRRVADALETPVVEYEVAEADAPTTPATTCSARYTGALPVGDCIRAAGHAPDIDHTDDSGRHFGDRSAEYPVHDGPELLGMRVGIDPGAKPGSVTVVGHWLPTTEQQRRERQELAGMLEAFIDAQMPQAPAAHEDEACLTHVKGACNGTGRDCAFPTPGTARRRSLRVLLNRLNNGVPLTADEVHLLTRHVAAEITHANQLRAGRETWKAKAEQMERARDEEERLRLALAEERTRWKKRAEEAQAAIERVRALHPKATHGEDCVHCAAFGPGYDNTWPCETLRALDGTEQPTPETGMCTATLGNEDFPARPHRCIAPAGHYDEEQQPTFTGPDRSPGGWHRDGQSRVWSDRAANSTPHREQPTEPS